MIKTPKFYSICAIVFLTTTLAHATHPFALEIEKTGDSRGATIHVEIRNVNDPVWAHDAQLDDLRASTSTQKTLTEHAMQLLGRGIGASNILITVKNASGSVIGEVKNTNGGINMVDFSTLKVRIDFTNHTLAMAAGHQGWDQSTLQH